MISIDMCNRCSMECVYCMWEVVFADIINNHKLCILYCYWLIILWQTPDDTHDLIEHLILLLTTLITVHLSFVCYFCLIPVYIFIICSHNICMCTFPFILTHLLGVLTPWILHIQVHVYSILLIRYLKRITHFTRSRSSLTWSSLLGILLLSFIHVVPFLFPTLDFCSILSFICYHCVRYLYVIL